MTDWNSLREELDRWADLGMTATLWWRDDDAALPDPALNRLLGLCAVPLALAVIPATVHEDTAGTILAQAAATVIQHGYAHRNHQPEGMRKCEFGDHRDMHDALDDLVIGRRRLEALFDDRFAAVLAPPWNRLSAPYTAQLIGVGLSGLTTYGPRATANPAPGVVLVNSHVDIIDWRGTRGFMGEAAALGLAVDHLAARRAKTVDAAEPTGLLSHHLIHDAAAWRFIEAFMAATVDHKAARWVAVADAFRPGGP